MDLILEIVGVVSIVGGIILCFSVVGIVLGLAAILEGILVFSVGSVYCDVKRLRNELSELKTWIQASIGTILRRE